MTRIASTFAALLIAPLVPVFSFMAANLVIRGPLEIVALPFMAAVSYVCTLAIAVPVHAAFVFLRVQSSSAYVVCGLGVAIVLQLYWYRLSLAADSGASSHWWQPWPVFLSLLVVCASTALVFWLLAIRTSNFSSSGRESA